MPPLGQHRRQPRSPAARLLLPLVVALLGCGPSATGSFASWQPTVIATPAIAELERQMFERLNRDRQAAGRPPLQWDARLADVARAHSDDMRQRGYFAHVSPRTGTLEDRLDRAGYLALEARENLAIAGDVERASDNLLRSPGHHANIVATSVTRVGIGIVEGADGLTITQVFARPTELSTPAETLASVRAAIAESRRAARGAPLAEHPILDALAKEKVGDLDAHAPGTSVGAIGRAIAQKLATVDGHGVRGVEILGQVVFNGADFRLPNDLATAPLRFVAIAASPAHDQRGRPAIKVLVILGE